MLIYSADTDGVTNTAYGQAKRAWEEGKRGILFVNDTRNPTDIPTKYWLTEVEIFVRTWKLIDIDK